MRNKNVMFSHCSFIYVTICGCSSIAVEKESMQPGSLQRIHDLLAIRLLHFFSSEVSMSFMPLDILEEFSSKNSSWYTSGLLMEESH